MGQGSLSSSSSSHWSGKLCFLARLIFRMHVVTSALPFEGHSVGELRSTLVKRVKMVLKTSSHFQVLPADSY